MSSTKGQKKIPITTHIRADLLAEARGAVYAVPGLKFTSLIEQALVSRLVVLRRRYNDGEPFPPKEKI